MVLVIKFLNWEIEGAIIQLLDGYRGDEVDILISREVRQLKNIGDIGLALGQLIFIDRINHQIAHVQVVVDNNKNLMEQQGMGTV